MKSPIKFSILVWLCNVVMAAIIIFLILGGYYYTTIPGLANIPQDSDGVIKSASSVSHSLLSENFIAERIINKEKEINSMRYYFSSTRNLYRVPISDSLSLSANKIDKELSSETSTYGGLFKRKITVTKPAGSMPVRFAAPAMSLQKEEYIRMARSKVIFFLLTLVYVFMFFWFLRKFIAGLRKPVFFTRQNAFYLYITSALVLIAPFLKWAWSNWIRTDLFSKYKFSGALEMPAGSELSIVLFLFGLILLVIAWCFDQGVKLQKEQELTI